MSKAKDLLAPRRAPRPKRADSVDIVEAILRAARELGDPDASLSAIASRAGVGVASVHRYFPTKSAIYAEIARRLQREFLDRLRDLLERPTISLEQAIEGCCRLAIEVPGVSPSMRRALNLSLPPAWSEETANASFSAAIEEIARWLSTRLDPPPSDLRERVFVAFAAARGVVMVSRILPDSAPTDEALIRQLVRMTRALLELPPPAGPAH